MRAALAFVVGLASVFSMPAACRAQQKPTQPGWPQPVHNNSSFYSVIAEQNEVRMGSGGARYRWDGEAWYGNNTNHLWLRSEGTLDLDPSHLDEAEVQALYARPFSTFFDLQAGLRYDIDPSPSRTWLTVGLEGMAPLYWHVGAFAFLSDGGHAAGRLEASYDLLLTQRLVLQPQIEATFYSKGEPRRGVVPGLSEFDSGLRLRYEIRRQIAPYVALIDQGGAGYGAGGADGAGGSPDGVLFAAGLRAWY